MRSALVAAVIVVYVLMLPFPFLASVLLAPAEGVAVLVGGWVIGAAVLVALARRRSWWVVAVPLVAIAYWVAVVTLGDVYFDWTA